jgi:hypothetical protein
MLLVTPDAVAGIIEVKTSVADDLGEVLEKLANNAAMVRGANRGRICPVGLFVYEPLTGNDAHDRLLKQVQAASHGDMLRAIDWIAAGPSLFVRFWFNGNEVNSPVQGGAVWHSYSLEALSHAYFVSSVVWDTARRRDPATQYAWFPVEGTKEQHRTRYIALDDTEPRPFNE